MSQHCNGKWEEDDAREGRGGAELGGRRGRTGKGQGEATELGRTGGGMEMEGRERRRNAGREVRARESLSAIVLHRPRHVFQGMPAHPRKAGA